MKQYIALLWLLSLLFLPGCEREDPAPTPSPPPVPTPTAAPGPLSTLELHVGRDAPSFRVELVRSGEPGELRVDVYEAYGEAEPVQQFTQWSPEYQLTELVAEDVDFDGYLDFHFLLNTGTQGEEYSAYYVWDPVTEQFVSDPYGLNDILNGRFYPHHGEVVSVTQEGERWTYYQYENGELVQTGWQEAGADSSDWRIRVDEENVFRIRAECTGKPRRDFPESDMGLTLTVCREGETQPLQVIGTGTMQWNSRFHLAARDVDFDGDMDFYYTYSEGLHGNSTRSFYIWDQETGTFLPDPYGLNGLVSTDFDGENRAVIERVGGTDYEQKRYYRCDPDTGELRLCRELYYGGWDRGGEMTVTDYQQGEAILTYSAESGETFSGPEYEEFCRWEDLDYYGSRKKVEVDRDHTLWVELTPRGDSEYEIWVNVYRNWGDTEPFQRFEDQAVNLSMADPTAEDVDFDGKTDFHFIYDYGSLPRWKSAYYIWDAKAEKFVPDPYGLNELPYSEFDGEEEVVTSYWNYGAVGGRRAWCRYIDGELACIRSLEIGSMEEDGSCLLRVWDRRDGELVKVWEERDPEGDRGETSYRRALARWEDLDYPARQEVRADKSHTFWVEVTDTGEPMVDGYKMRVCIYKDETKQDLLQTFDSWWAEGGMNCFSVEDVDFDGDMDLAVCNQEYRSFHWQTYYIWDEEQEHFIEDPYGLHYLGGAEFDPERKIIETAHWNVMGGHTSYYRYEGNALICIRTMSWGFNSKTGRQDLLVKDGWDGELRVVYDYAAALDELVEGMVGTQEFFRWQDLDYHGRGK